MQQYLDFLRYILDHGTKKPDRTGIGTLSTFGYQMRFNLDNQFPLLTTKTLHWKSIVYELLWFLRGDTNIDYLQQNGIRIWNSWADAQGELGPIYGKQWRCWERAEGEPIDQIAKLVENIRHSPHSRRLIVSAWNVAQLDDMALPPCHLLFQCYVANGRLSCQLYQRSADAFLGVPFNIASYSLLTYMLAQQCQLQPGEFIWNGGDCHLYENHLSQAELQLQRTPYPAPQLVIKSVPKSIFEYTFEDFSLVNYQAHPHIRAEIAV